MPQPGPTETLEIPAELRQAVAPEVVLAGPRPSVTAALGSDFFGRPRYQLDPNGHLDLSQWAHVAAQGRDHYVRLVYEGNLSDLGHRAALVKVSERRFEAGPDGQPVAYLRQYMYVVVREPEKEYTGLAHDGRGLHVTKVRLTTMVTPHIDYPYTIAGDPSYVPPGVIAGSDRSFWVTVGGEDFPFHGIATDSAGHEFDFAKPLIFVPLSETAWPALHTATTTLAGRVRLQTHVPGQRIAFAPPDPGDPKDNTTLVAETFMLDHEGYATREQFFRPRLYKADVRIPAVEALTGSSAPTSLTYAQPYLDGGFGGANQTDVFASVVTMDPGTGALTDAGMRAEFQASQAGGFATPALAVTTLTRGLGPLGGPVTDALNDNFDPATVLGGADVMLFGAFPLADVLVVGPASVNAPTMQVHRDGASVVSELDWTSPVSAYDAGIVSFTPQGGPGLHVHAVIRKDATGNGSSMLHGDLSPFDVTFLESLIIHFTSFTFDAQSGQKTKVTVGLRDDGPVEFTGDLAFVEELRNLIPPGVFGDGVSIDLIQSPLAIKAGLAITLPPAAIGVFALKNISFSAGLTVPFLDGKPVAEFGFARRDAPFTLAVLIFGGGGFFHIEVDTDGIRMLEAALEFGATAALDIGVASGEVHIMAGIYFAMVKRSVGGSDEMVASLTGYLRCGGSLCVLGIVRISVEFYLSFTYQSPGKATGRATLIVSVEIGPFSKSIDLTVEKTIGGQGGDPTFAEMLPTADLWAEYAGAFA